LAFERGERRENLAVAHVRARRILIDDRAVEIEAEAAARCLEGWSG